MNMKERAKKLKTDLPAVFYAMKKKETPILAKVIAGVAIVYALSPIDLIPDFIPVLGYLDDLIILPALIGLTIRLIPEEILEQCRIEGRTYKKPQKRWTYGIPFVFIWGILIFLFLKFLMNVWIK